MGKDAMPKEAREERERKALLLAAKEQQKR